MFMFVTRNPKTRREICNQESENPYGKIKHSVLFVFFFVKTASLQPADKFELIE
jgi:hypothetical protein